MPIVRSTPRMVTVEAGVIDEDDIAEMVDELVSNGLVLGGLAL